MREIKFRAWDESRKEWSQQSFAIDQNGGLSMWKQQSNSSNYSYGHTDLHPIISMFTGLLDKNGKEIYEGDIINHPNFEAYNNVRFNSQVVFEDACFHLRTGEPVLRQLWKLKPHTIEVIGNIYENPELLETK